MVDTGLVCGHIFCVLFPAFVETAQTSGGNDLPNLGSHLSPWGGALSDTGTGLHLLPSPSLSASQISFETWPSHPLVPKQPPAVGEQAECGLGGFRTQREGPLGLQHVEVSLIVSTHVSVGCSWGGSGGVLPCTLL